MCTLTWRDEDGLEIFFNRDERKTRSRALPPQEITSPDGTRYLSPIDPDAGGTWMLVNEHGLAVCLLNRWHQESGQVFNKSRGQIVAALASERSVQEIAAHLPALCPDAKPFDLVAFLAKEARGFRWDGSQLTFFEPEMPLTSSSYCFEEVREARSQAFSQSDNLEDFQASARQPKSAFTVRMNRPDAQTWSRSHLVFSPQSVRWDYWEEFPDLEEEPRLHQITLTLRRNSERSPSSP